MVGTSSLRRRSIMSCVAGRKVRTVPTSFACAGITLIAPGLPACIAQMLITAVSIGLTLRLTIDCTGAMTAAPVDGDLDPVGRRHRRAGRDADGPGGQARPVVQRIDLLRGKALAE